MTLRKAQQRSVREDQKTTHYMGKLCSGCWINSVLGGYHGAFHQQQRETLRGAAVILDISRVPGESEAYITFRHNVAYSDCAIREIS